MPFQPLGKSKPASELRIDLQELSLEQVGGSGWMQLPSARPRLNSSIICLVSFRRLFLIGLEDHATVAAAWQLQSAHGFF
jgi:hypothetical protein